MFMANRKTTMVKAFLFDYGGTLDTSARHWVYVLQEGFEHAGFPLSDEVFRPAYIYAERALARHPYIRPTDDFFTLLHKKVTLEVEYLVHHGSLSPTSYGEQARMVEQVALYCDAYARNQVKASGNVLKCLTSKYKMVIVSNFYGNLPTILRAYGISGYFEQVIESAVVGVRKPDSAIYRLGVQAAGVLPEECVVVGDSYTKDVLPAHALGCQTVWFKGLDWEPTERDESLPTHVIGSLGELLDYYG